MKKSYYTSFFPKAGWGKISINAPKSLILDLQLFLQRRLIILNRKMKSWALKNNDKVEDYSSYQKKLEEFKVKNLPDDLHHFLKGEFDLKTRLSKKLCRLFGEKNFVKKLKKKLKAETLFIHYPPMLRFKYADSPGSILPPHQDFSYSPHLKDFVTVWMPLVRINKKVGGLVMYNKSQNLTTEQDRQNKYWTFGIAEEKIRKYKKVQPTLNLGEALIFPSGFVHGSALQLDKKNNRLSIDFRIFTEKTMTSKSYFDCQSKKVIKLH